MTTKSKSSVEDDIQSKSEKQLSPIINNKEFLPKNLLTTLTTKKEKRLEDLGPKTIRQKKYTRQAIDNVWNYEKGRAKLDHLIEQPPCVCGSGRDISYLLDAASVDKKNMKENGKETCEEKGNETYGKTSIPESIIPSEFYVVKHKGVVALEIHDEKYTTTCEDHAGHQTLFPSMKPSGRQEALQLMKTMDNLLRKAGVNDNLQTLKDDNLHSNQTDNLLTLVKNEQRIYNIIFNEVIRQVSTVCIERGTVLAELRKRYTDLLDRVPKQVKSLHEEVLAQRALDRRLTEELSRFKTSITVLTRELHEIHAHDKEVSKQAIETQAELNEALKESEKNASLLAEYHDLYELQRRRLDLQLVKLIEERDLWAGSAHMLSIKVTEKHNLVTIQRLHLFEKAWYKLANRFSVMLGHEDEKHLQVLAGHVHNWQEITDLFNKRLCAAEKETCRRIKSIQESMKDWERKFVRVVTPDEGSVNPLDIPNIQSLFKDLKLWEEIFNSEAERFTGNLLLSCEDDLLQLNTCVDLWTESAVKIFGNHPVQDGVSHVQHLAMADMNKKVEQLHNKFKLRMSGENGLAKGIIQFINSFDTWVNKINILIHGGETLFDSEWVQLADLFQVQWKESLDNIILMLSPNNLDEVNDVQNATQKWLTATIDAFENEDNNIVEQVATTHSNMIRWMITILIQIAPDIEDPESPIAKHDEDKTSGLGALILNEATSHAIIDRAKVIFNWLYSLTNVIVLCCKDILNYQEPKNSNEKCSRSGDDIKDMKKIQVECQGWINTANLLVHELTGESIQMDDCLLFKNDAETLKTTDYSNISTQRNASGPATSTVETTIGIDYLSQNAIVLNCQEGMKPAYELNEDTMQEQDDTVEMHVIGTDENVNQKLFSEASKQGTIQHTHTKDVKSSLSLEAISALDQLQKQLMLTEARAQSAEDRAFVAESALKEAHERIRALERSISRVEDPACKT